MKMALGRHSNFHLNSRTSDSLVDNFVIAHVAPSCMKALGLKGFRVGVRDDVHKSLQENTLMETSS